MTRLELSILKELDKKNFKYYEIGIIMNKVKDKKSKVKLLDYLINNRFEVITVPMIIKFIYNFNV
ncbi:MAG: hypothetical protein MR296_03110 [Tenericutes bacterium]|nr:hypothetical protein [Mycoplasmatota bacterium]